MRLANSIYFVGIKGVAQAALAIYCKEAGIRVGGCDTEEEFPTDQELAKAKISFDRGFDPKFLRKNADLVVYTGAHAGSDNPVVKKAEELGIRTLPHGRALGAVMEGKRQITVAGSHGKTTTAAMIATILRTAGKDPSYAIGCGSIGGIGAAGHFGRGEFFVAEGDEYVTDSGHDQTPRFLWQKPEIAVVTNIDFDHPDAYADLKAVQEAFVALQQKSEGKIINADDKKSNVLSGTSFGFSPMADFRVSHVGVGNERMFFTLEKNGMELGEFSLKVPGKHNVLNAAAAVAACQTLGFSMSDIRKGLLTFTGTKRRFEKIGESNGIIFYDDYAHHPAEIRATLAGAKAWYPGKNIIAVFQPHTYSRTKALLGDFSRSFADADEVILTDVYASAREHDTLGITGKTLVAETLKHHKNVRYGENFLDVVGILDREAKPGDIVILMGAGNIYMWGRRIWKKNF